MTECEWKPGDVAMVTIPSRGDVIAMFMDGGTWETPWAEADGATTYKAASNYSYGLAGRPLVVIDPDDRAQVERLTEALFAAMEQVPSPDEHRAAYWSEALPLAMAPALRSLLAPPKPDEPTGLGAVVEDADGVRWVNVFEKGMWQDHSDRNNWRLNYADINAVRVLSEGVQS